MKIIKFIFVLLIIFLIIDSSYSKPCGISILINKNDSAKKTTYPIFLPHGGIGFANGVRYGLLVQVSEHFSGEISRGQYIGNFFVLSDSEKELGFGISYHLSNKVPLFISALFSIGTKREGLTDTPKYYYSINAGYINLIKYNLNFFARGGLGFKQSTINKDHIEFESAIFNIDVGLGFAF